MKFDQQEIEDVRAVFGDEGAAMAAELDYDVGDISRVLKDDDGSVKMEIAGVDMGDPYVRIHEFAHYYHCKLFPDLTEACAQYQAEAVAFMAENFLAVGRTLPDDWTGLRRMYWEDALLAKSSLRPAVDVVNFAERLPKEDIRDTVKRILTGEFG